MMNKLAGGSAALAAARAVVAGDEAVVSFAGSETPLAVAVREAVNEADVNHTARWLERNGKVFQILVAHLSTKMARSRDLNVIEDHVQTFLARLIEKDTLAPFLKGGKPVQMSVLRVWAYQSASTELRRWATDGALRATRGLKTAREVQRGKAFRPVVHPAAVREVPREGMDPDYHDPAEASPDDALDRKSRVDMVRRHLARIGQPHMVPVIDGLLAGESLDTLCAAHGVTAKQITAVLRGLRA